MPREKSAGAIIFRPAKTGPEYLLLHYPSLAKAKKDYWDFPKGHTEKGEKEKETAQRELREETGLQKAEFLDGFREIIHYFFQFQGKRIFKTVVFYLGQTKEKTIIISPEHIGYQWLPYGEALKQLKFSNAKNVLGKAHDFLLKREFHRLLRPSLSQQLF